MCCLVGLGFTFDRGGGMGGYLAGTVLAASALSHCCSKDGPPHGVNRGCKWVVLLLGLYCLSVHFKWYVWIRVWFCVFGMLCNGVWIQQDSLLCSICYCFIACISWTLGVSVIFWGKVQRCDSRLVKKMQQTCVGEMSVSVALNYLLVFTLIVQITLFSCS